MIAKFLTIYEIKNFCMLRRIYLWIATFKGVEFNANMIASDLNYDLKRVEKGLNNIQKTVKFTVTNEKEYVR
jgi:hypothetical protein